MSDLVLENTSVIQNGWMLTTLDEFTYLIFGQSPPSSSYNKNGQGLPFFQGRSEFGKLHPKIKVWCTKPNRIAEKNDVLICVRAGVGGTNLNPIKSCIGRGLASVRTLSGVNPLYVLYYLRSIEYILSQKGRGSTLTGITSPELRQLQIPIAPLNEQKRIVAKIEELFSLLDNVFQILDKLKLQLVTFEKSLYHSALLGTFSRNWRSNTQSPDSKKLLPVILEERRKKWEKNQSDKFEQMGKTPKNNDWKKKYREPFDPDSNLPSIPNSWNWITLDQITWSVRDGPHYSPQYSESGIPFITGGNVRPDGIDFENCKVISSDLHNELIKRCKPEKNDVLYTKGGTTGIARVNTYDHDFSVWVHVAVLKLVDSIKPFFVQHALNSPFCYQQSQKYTHGVGNQDLGLTRMIKIHLTLPPIEEQDYIIKNLEKNLSEIHHLKSNINKFVQYANNLKSVILKQAFEGKLVPQDPNDEPAKILLEKIKQEKQKIISQSKRGKKNDK